MKIQLRVIGWLYVGVPWLLIYLEVLAEEAGGALDTAHYIFWQKILNTYAKTYGSKYGKSRSVD